MPHRCKSKKGSFGAHFDEVVKHFPKSAPPKRQARPEDPLLRETRDIHALLFERAWKLDAEDRA